MLDQCPICKTKIPYPLDRRFASILCPECSSHLWVINRDGSRHLFDAKDKDLFLHWAAKYRAEDRVLFASNGWVEQNRKSDSFYDRMVEKQKFSLQADSLIDLPFPAVGIDLSSVPYRWPDTTPEEKAIELRLRKTMIGCFKTTLMDKVCCVIDVNHSQYSFVPSHVIVDERWPVHVYNYAEFTSFNSHCFSQGVLFNPRNKHLVAYGDDFAEPFRKEFSALAVDPIDAISKSEKTK